MDFLKHIFKRHAPIAITILSVFVLAVIVKVFAAGPFAPGTELDPNCLPTDVGCTVTAGGAPGGSDTQVQFNNSGSFAGSGDFTWDNSSKSFVAGNGSTAPGINSISMGHGSIASGSFSTAIGDGATASGSDSTAFGDGTEADGSDSTAFGNGTLAVSNFSTAFGTDMTVGTDATDAQNSVGIGLDTTPRTITTPHVLSIMGGNVGIGTASPSGKLHVVGSGTDSSTSAIKVIDGNGLTGLNLVEDSAIGMQSTTHWKFDRSGLGTTTETGIVIQKDEGIIYPNQSDERSMLEVKANSTAHPSVFTVFNSAANSNSLIHMAGSNGTQSTELITGGLIGNDLAIELSHDNGFSILNSSDVKKFVVDSNYNVGIGTASPTSKLHILGSASDTNLLNVGSDISSSIFSVTRGAHVYDSNTTATGELRVSSDGSGLAGGPTLEVYGAAVGPATITHFGSDLSSDILTLREQGQVWIGTGSGSASVKLHVKAGGFSSIPFRVDTSSIDNAFLVDSTGNVGIGTATPTSAKTVIVGDNGASPIEIKNTFAGPPSPETTFKIDSSGGVTLGATDRSASTVNFGLNLVPNAGDYNLAFKDPTNSAFRGVIQQSGSNNMQFFVNGGSNNNIVMKLYDNGTNSDVGIGGRGWNGSFGWSGVTPSATLHIKGMDSTSSNYALKIDDAAGTPNPLLYVRDDGNVGIGTASPSWPLEVSGDASIAQITTTNGATGIAQLRLKSPSQVWTIGNDVTNNSLVFNDFTGSGANIVFNTGGHVGIDTISPNSTLQIGTPVDSFYTYLQFDAEASAPPGGDCGGAADKGRAVYDSGADKLYICDGVAWQQH